ncbi:MAG: hypothetical protein K6F05_05740 [Succinivibrio sp.]|nr:hypothetical protein [Succinivibrio sp.]
MFNLKRHLDLLIAAAFTLLTCLMVPCTYTQLLDSINLIVLGLLYCLMVTIQGMRLVGILQLLLRPFLSERTSLRALARFFIGSCFLLSMLLTNDVSLIMLVPLAILMLKESSCSTAIPLVLALMTIAANLGSMLTPIGNPQNLYLYTHYELTLLPFMQAIAPAAVLSALLLWGCTYYFSREPLSLYLPKAELKSPYRGVLVSALFLACVLCVLRLLAVEELLAVTFVVLGLVDYRLLLKADFKLLLLFVVLFIGVGNLSRLPELGDLMAEMFSEHEFYLTLLSCQFISNVPAAVLLSNYTGNWQELLWGVSVGGLGTLVASMASLITFRAYVGQGGRKALRYILLFTLLNAAFLVPLCLLHELCV